MITEVKLYSATCDNCNGLHEDNNSGETTFSDEDRLVDSLVYQGWGFSNDKTYCKSCHYHDDDDNLVVNFNCN
jgi:hypothetical protein